MAVAIHYLHASCRGAFPTVHAIYQAQGKFGLRIEQTVAILEVGLFA